MPAPRTRCAALALIACSATLVLLASCATDSRSRDLALEYYNLGNAYAELGRHDKAAEAFRAALRLDAGLTRADYNLALAMVRLGRPAEAVAVLEQLAAADPGNVTVILALAWALHEGGREDDALARWDEAARLAPENRDAPYNAALVLWKAGRRAESIERFRALLVIAPDDADALFNLGALLLETDDAVGAAEALGRYVERTPRDPAGLLLLGGSLERQRGFARALELYERALALDANSATAWFAKARLELTVVEDPERGLADLRKALELGWRDADAIAALLSTEGLARRAEVEQELASRSLLPGAAPEASAPSP